VGNTLKDSVSVFPGFVRCGCEPTTFFEKGELYVFENLASHPTFDNEAFTAGSGQARAS